GQVLERSASISERRRRGIMSSRGHVLHFRPGTYFTLWPGCLGLVSSLLLVGAAEAVGMWESLVLGFPHFHRLIIGRQVFFPETLHLQFMGVEAGDRYCCKVHAAVAIIDR